ncbi:hypothetical protein [Mobilicoccus pelagius]|uniref:Glycosyltransferase RgtA/B/C/D-like domain-containing protein n=1 Tax=Mobilicoccus pelagius NBRC 104925 TaxID=1089455 RepID=H5UMZ0_9MICO|nr:hypothetical protein [Mobilicoccus pelagius]GAB47098.1 hypothetical protein MOPEL_003_01230 [Mobilicoccus pelagius NBRC 104925]
MGSEQAAVTAVRRRRGGWWPAAIALVAAAGGVLAFLARVGWGLDRTDEGQYLLLLADPTMSRATVFLFGYVLHPLFALVGGDVLALRVVGMLVGLLTAGALGWAATRALGLLGADAWAVRGVAATAGLLPVVSFPLTPSYNTLAFWGTCLWASGLVLATWPGPGRAHEDAHDGPRDAESAPGPRRRLGAIARDTTLGPALVGLGGVVAASGKVTTGAALAALTLVAVVVRAVTSRRQVLPFVGWVAGGAVVGLVALMALVGHGPAWIVDFYREGARNVALLQGHDDLVRWDPFPWIGFLAAPALAVVVAALVSWRLLRRGAPTRRRGRAIAAVTALAVLVEVVAFATGLAPTRAVPMVGACWWIPLLAIPVLLTTRRTPGSGTDHSVTTTTTSTTPMSADDEPAPTTSASAVASTSASTEAHASRRPGQSRAVEAVTLLALTLAPLAYVVGTNGNYAIAQARACLFWFVAVLLLTGVRHGTGRREGERRLVRRVVTAASAGLVLVASLSGLGHAYRYPPVTSAWSDPAATEVAVVSPEGARLRVTKADAETSRLLAEVDREHHLAGVPILDVTGASPGYVRQLGGRPVGSSWLLGAYPGSLDAALDAVRGDDPTLVDRAWVLDAPASPRRIEGLLPALGRSVDRDYETVATFRHTLGYEVRLLRPVTGS